MTGLLRIRGLDVTIGAARVLGGIDLDVAAGEIVALTGESGAGKSMTGLAVMGLLPGGARATGSIRVGGAEVLGAPEAVLCRMRGREVGMVFQEPMTALDPLQTIGAQVAEVIRLHARAPRAEALRRAAATLERVGLPADRFPPSRYPHELSGGQRQRVVIAMAVAMGPRLLIADEPTTALDVTTQAQILALLRRLTAEDGMGVLLITHDLAVVAETAAHIAVMRAGEIVEAGPTAEVMRAPRHPYTRALFAASAHVVARRPAAPGGPLLEVTQIRRDYALPRAGLFGPAPTFRALDRVSLEIREGERVGLVGESGSGKSTLARAVLGLEPVQAGRVTLDGRPVSDMRRLVQAVFQDPYGSFNPRHRVGRAIAEPFHLLDDPPKGAARQDAVAEALEAVGLAPEDGGKYIHEFSGGQRQRIAIARALVIRPKLLVLDEAVSALDVSVRARVLDLIAGLADRFGLAYLFISHDLTVVRGITDRVLVMHEGRIIEEGPTAQVLEAPSHPYTRSLLAAAPRLPVFAPADAQG